MIDIVSELKTWLNGLEIVKLAKACKAFWDDVKTWLELPLTQRDIENCHPLALKAHGWGRRTEQFPGEDPDLYRTRVLNAFENLGRAGLIKGLEEMLTEFQVPEFTILERQPQVDPDVVTIEMPQGGITDDQDLLLKIFQEYGMTCRRYAQAVSEVIEIKMPSDEVEHNQISEVVEPYQSFIAEETINMNVPAGMFGHDQYTEIVSV